MREMETVSSLIVKKFNFMRACSEDLNEMGFKSGL